MAQKARTEAKEPGQQDKRAKKPRLRMAVAALLMLEGLSGCACKTDDPITESTTTGVPSMIKDAGTDALALDLAPLHTARNEPQEAADLPALDADASAGGGSSD